MNTLFKVLSRIPDLATAGYDDARRVTSPTPILQPLRNYSNSYKYQINSFPKTVNHLEGITGLSHSNIGTVIGERSYPSRERCSG